MRRITLIAGLLVAALVIGYGGWLSWATTASSGSGGGDDTSQDSGKPGEAPKD